MMTWWGMDAFSVCQWTSGSNIENTILFWYSITKSNNLIEDNLNVPNYIYTFCFDTKLTKHNLSDKIDVFLVSLKSQLYICFANVWFWSNFVASLHWFLEFTLVQRKPALIKSVPRKYLNGFTFRNRQSLFVLMNFSKS